MKMEFDSEQIARYIELLKSYDLMLSAHRAALESLGLLHRPDLVSALDEAIRTLSPQIEANYADAMTNLLKLPTELERQQFFSRLLEQWTPANRKPA